MSQDETTGIGPQDDTVRVPDDRGNGETVRSRHCDVPEEQLWSWIDRDASELDAHLAECTQCRHRAERMRSQIKQVADGHWKRVVDEDAPPETIGAYRIFHEIARGGHGIVYLAEHEEDNFKRRFAIKILKRDLDPEILNRFEFERQLLGAMNHPGIARLYDAGRTDDGRPYFVMEYVEGTDVAKYCDHHRLSIPERLTLFRKVCSAVHYAHGSLVVHRDLKPSNILVTTDGEPKLLDFGIAKCISPERSLIAGTPTAPEFRVMTPEYASPEQVRGDPITIASDVYSLGVLLYELLSGHRPYRLKSIVRAELERVICEVDPERPSTAISRIEEEWERDPKTGTRTSRQITPDSVSRSRVSRPDRLRKRLEGDIDNIVLMAMRKEPQRRYHSAEQFAEDIERHLKGQPVIARKDTFGYRTSKFVRRNKFGVGAAATIAVVLVGGIVGTWSQARAAIAAQSVAETREQEAVQARDGAEAARVQERAQRERAERLFSGGRRLAHVLMYDIGDALETIEGGLPARDLFVNAAVDYLDSVTSEAAGDAELQDELADGYRRIGDIVGGVRNPNHGDLAQALEHYESALKIREARLATAPDDPALLRKAASTRVKVGDVLGRLGRTEDALATYRACLDAFRKLVERDPTVWKDRRAVAIVLVKVGDQLMELGDRDDGRQQYRDSEAIRLQLIERNYERPRDARRARRELAVIISRISGEHSVAGEHERALTGYQRALEIREALFRDAPVEMQARRRRDVLVAHQLVAGELTALGRTEEAIRHLAMAFPLAELRTERNPGDLRARYDLANIHFLNATAHATSDRWDRAAEHYEICQTSLIEMTNEHPEDVRSSELLVRARLGLGQCRAATDDPRAAARHGKEALAVVRQLRQKDERNEDLMALNADVLRELGTWQRDTGLQREARENLAESRRLFEALLESQPGNDRVRVGLEQTIGEIERESE